MRIEIGPVSRESAVAWLDYATSSLEILIECCPARTPDEALAGFGELIAEWREVVRRPGDFHWVTERPPSQVEFLVNALFEAGLAIEEQHEVGRAMLRPAEADEFHLALVNQGLAALEAEGKGSAQFAEILRGEWGIAGP